MTRHSWKPSLTHSRFHTARLIHLSRGKMIAWSHATDLRVDRKKSRHSDPNDMDLVGPSENGQRPEIMWSRAGQILGIPFSRPLPPVPSHLSAQCLPPWRSGGLPRVGGWQVRRGMLAGPLDPDFTRHVTWDASHVRVVLLVCSPIVISLGIRVPKRLRCRCT